MREFRSWIYLEACILVITFVKSEKVEVKSGGVKNEEERVLPFLLYEASHVLLFPFHVFEAFTLTLALSLEGRGNMKE